MLTFCTIPKPFCGHIGTIHRNALRSWSRLSAKHEILLFGADEGVAEIAQDLEARHIPVIQRNESGVPLLDDVFGKAQNAARYETICYINADIILDERFVRAAASSIRSSGAAFVNRQGPGLSSLALVSRRPDRRSPR